MSIVPSCSLSARACQLDQAPMLQRTNPCHENECHGMLARNATDPPCRVSSPESCTVPLTLLITENQSSPPVPISHSPTDSTPASDSAAEPPAAAPARPSRPRAGTRGGTAGACSKPMCTGSVGAWKEALLDGATDAAAVLSAWNDGRVGVPPPVAGGGGGAGGWYCEGVGAWSWEGAGGCSRVTTCEK